MLGAKGDYRGVCQGAKSVKQTLAKDHLIRPCAAGIPELVGPLEAAHAQQSYPPALFVA